MWRGSTRGHARAQVTLVQIPEPHTYGPQGVTPEQRAREPMSNVCTWSKTEKYSDAVSDYEPVNIDRYKDNVTDGIHHTVGSLELSDLVPSGKFLIQFHFQELSYWCPSPYHKLTLPSDLSLCSKYSQGLLLAIKRV